MTGLPAPALSERVLALLPSPKDTERTVRFLAEAGVACAACSDLPALCQELTTGADTVLLSEEAIHSDRCGYLLAALREQPTWSMIPLVVLVHEDGSRRLERWLDQTAANVTLVERPVRTRTLVSVVQASLRARRHQYQIRDAIAERERHAGELRERDERLRFALAAGRLGAWELDFASGEMACSDIFLAHFGRSPGERFSDEDLKAAVHPRDAACVQAALQQALAERSDYDVEHRVVWPDGQVRWVLVRGRATYAADECPLCMVGVSLDVTERREAEAALGRQAEQLREADQRKDEFLATLAHELRNPLAPVRTGLAILQREPHGEAASKARKMMDRQIGHMVRLIDDLLDVSRITRGKVELRRERVPLQALLDAGIEGSRPLLDAAQHQLAVSVPPEPLWVDADPTRLAQILSNLVNNAAKYTPNGGHIAVSARREGAAAVVEVRDDGLGIPSEKLAEVFELFSQVNRTLDRSQGGLGIGLALARKLVEMHRGTISATSAGLGQGSTFTVRLALAAPRESAPDVRRDAAAGGVNGWRILVVDDNVDAAESLSMFLQLSGHDTRIAHSGPEGIDAARAFQPEVVFLDIGLPGMNGYEIARRLRQEGALLAAMLIAVTGWGTEEDKKKAIEAGFDFHLTKPVETNAIEGLLFRVSDRRRAQSR